MRLRRSTIPLAVLGLGLLAALASLPACRKQQEIPFRPEVSDLRLPAPESDAIRVAGETVFNRDPATVTSESAGEGKTRVALTDKGGQRTEMVVESETEFSAQSAGIPLPPGVTKSLAMRLSDAKFSNPQLSMFEVDGMRQAVYVIANTTIDEIVAFYTGHNSGRFGVVQDMRPLGMECVILGVEGEDDLALGILPDTKTPTNAVVALLDQSKTKIGSQSSQEVE